MLEGIMEGFPVLHICWYSFLRSVVFAIIIHFQGFYNPNWEDTLARLFSIGKNKHVKSENYEILVVFTW